MASLLLLGVCGFGLQMVVHANAQQPASASSSQRPPAQTVKIAPPPGLLPRDRGRPTDTFLDPSGLNLGFGRLLNGFDVPSLLNGVALPQPNLGALSGLLPSLPSVDLGTVQNITGAVPSTVGQLLQQLGDAIQGTAAALGGAVSAGATTPTSPGASVSVAEVAVVPADNEGLACGSISYTVAVVGKAPVSLSVSGGPPGGTQSISPSTMTGNGTATLTQSIPCGTAVGEYTGWVVATNLATGARSPAPFGVSVLPTTSWPPAAISYQLSTTDYSSGLTQQFSLPLCVPTPIDAASTSTLSPPTTIVSLCPIPLALTTQVIAPAPSQPAQLYLSVQRIAGSPAFPGRFLASYTPPTTSLTIQFQADSGSTTAYPGEAIVGAATDYNPYTNSSAATHATMGWATDGPESKVSVGVSGVGEADVDQTPADSGSLALTFDNGDTNAQLTNSSAWTSSTASIALASLLSPRATVTWSHLPQDFTFALNPLSDGSAQPAGLGISGNQSPSPNTAFAVEIDSYDTGGNLATQFVQGGFGGQFPNPPRP